MPLEYCTGKRDRKNQLWTVIFATRFKRKKGRKEGRKFPVVSGEKCAEERFDRKVGVSGKTSNFRNQFEGNFFMKPS